MEFTDLTPESLDRLEAKLAAELDTVRRMKALLMEHFRPRALAGAAPVTVPLAAGGAPVPAAGGEPPAPMPQVLPEMPPVPWKDLKTRVQEWAAERRQSFRMADLVKRLRGYGERSTLRSALMRLVADGEVLIVTKGRGRGGSLYQSKPAPAPAAGEMVEPVAEAAGNGSPAPDIPARGADKSL